MAGEVDASGERERSLTAFLERKLAEGYRVETHTDTHAIIVQSRSPFWTRLRRREGGRYVVQVDEHGRVTMSKAEPIRR